MSSSSSSDKIYLALNAAVLHITVINLITSIVIVFIPDISYDQLVSAKLSYDQLISANISSKHLGISSGRTSLNLRKKCESSRWKGNNWNTRRG